MTVKNLLVELFVEELPPKDLKKFGESFAGVLVESLKKQGLCTDHSATTSFASPRRLAVHVSAVRAQADEKAQSQKLVPVSVGLNAEGQPTPALLKKLASLGRVLLRYSGTESLIRLLIEGRDPDYIEAQAGKIAEAIKAQIGE